MLFARGHLERTKKQVFAVLGEEWWCHVSAVEWHDVGGDCGFPGG